VELSHLLENIDVIEIKGESGGDVLSVCYDSKSCGRGSLFVAIPGLSRDGHDFIPEAVAGGASYILHENNFIPPPGVTAIKVTNSRRTLGILGKNYYRNPSAELCLIGVMGTNGKTTVTYLLESVFGVAGYCTGVLGTVNYRYRDKIFPAPNTTPESFEFQKILREMADHGVTHVIAEVSSHAVDLRRVDDCVFALGIFTNLSQDHLDYHKTMENYFQAKLRFFREILPAAGKRRPGKMIINGDDPWGQRILKEANCSGVIFGLQEGSDVRGEIVSLTAEGIKAIIHDVQGVQAISSPLIGRFNLYNVLAAVGAAMALDVPAGSIREGIAGLTGVPGRLQRISLWEEPNVFVDYAHTPDALLRVLQNLVEFRRGKIITVFGCGGNRDRGKRPLMGSAATIYSDVTIITSDNPRGEDPLQIISEIEGGVDLKSVRKLSSDQISANRGVKCYTLLPDRQKAIELAVRLAIPGDTVLIAGKGHEDYQIVGQKRFPFDDRLVAREALDARRNSNLRP
jgi:UDP-N-acetylmuramoyl-L-alanyl-D-glutamate--2,6-diaminopimelate ligase